MEKTCWLRLVKLEVQKLFSLHTLQFKCWGTRRYLHGVNFLHTLFGDCLELAQSYDINTNREKGARSWLLFSYMYREGKFQVSDLSGCTTVLISNWGVAHTFLSPGLDMFMCQQSRAFSGSSYVSRSAATNQGGFLVYQLV